MKEDIRKTLDSLESIEENLKPWMKQPGEEGSDVPAAKRKQEFLKKYPDSPEARFSKAGDPLDPAYLRRKRTPAEMLEEAATPLLDKEDYKHKLQMLNTLQLIRDLDPQTKQEILKRRALLMQQAKEKGFIDQPISEEVGAPKYIVWEMGQGFRDEMRQIAKDLKLEVERSGYGNEASTTWAIAFYNNKKLSADQWEDIFRDKLPGVGWMDVYEADLNENIYEAADSERNAIEQLKKLPQPIMVKELSYMYVANALKNPLYWVSSDLGQIKLGSLKELGKYLDPATKEDWESFCDGDMTAQDLIELGILKKAKPETAQKYKDMDALEIVRRNKP